jgi:hypothetical protein
MQSSEMTTGPSARDTAPVVPGVIQEPWRVRAASGRILVVGGVVAQSHDFARIVVAAGRADMVRALQLAAVAAFRRVGGHERIMRTAHVAAGTGDSVLRDSHVSTFN